MEKHMADPKQAQSAPVAQKPPKPTRVDVKALGFDLLHLHQNVLISAGCVQNLILDPFLQAQIDAGKCEIVQD